MKKLIAKFSAMALLFALFIVPKSEAAGVAVSASLNAGLTELTITPTVDLVAGDNITLRLTTTADGNPVNLSAAQATAVTVGGSNETVQMAGNPGDVHGYIEVNALVSEPVANAPIVVTLPALADNTAYTVIYRDSQSNFGAAMINVGTSNQVTVTARVEPILTMSLTNTAIDLGTLSPSAITTNSSTGTILTVGTNALTGWTASVSDDDATGSGAGLTSATASHTISASDAATSVGTEAFDIQVSETTDPQTNGTISDNFNDDSGDVALSSSDQTIASGTGPTSGYQATIDYRAGISTITPAANDYTTTLTYSVTATY